MTDRDIQRLVGLHPDFISKVGTILAELPMFVVEGLRTAERQHELWEQGRSKPGKIVTNCDGQTTHSPHQAKVDGYGHAADLAFSPTDEFSSPFDLRHPWNQYGLLAESLHLVWGGRFRLRDYDHIELP